MLRPFFEEEKDFFEHWFAHHPCSHLATDVYQEKDDVIVEMHIPGVEHDDISVEVLGSRVLKVSGSKQHSEEKKKANFHKKEMLCGSFDELVTLPADVEADQASAQVSNGVLRVTLPIQKGKGNATKKIMVSKK